MRRTDSLEKTLMVGKIEGRRRGWQRMRWLNGITDLMDMNLSKLGICDGQGSLGCCSPWGPKETRLCDWTELNRGPLVKNPSSNAGKVGLIPGWVIKIPRAVGQLSPCTTTAEPTHWSLCSTTREKPIRINRKSCMPQLTPRQPNK